MWILIITIFTFSGVSINSVEFATRKTCLEASDTYSNSYWAENKAKSALILCVKK